MRIHLLRYPCLLLSFFNTAFGASKPDVLPTTSAVTVLVDFESPHSEMSLAAMRRGLGDILAPAGITVDVELKSDLRPNSQFAELVVFKMKGFCTMDPKSIPIGALSDERGPLAMAYASDGAILHFGEVECDRIRTSITRVLGRSFLEKNQNALGRAMAMVVAHEIYHMIGNAKEHTHKGVTKNSLSAEELLDGGLKLPAEAIEALGKNRSLSAVSEP